MQVAFTYRRTQIATTLVCLFGLLLSGGCSKNIRDFRLSNDWSDAPSYHSSVQTKIEYPNECSCLHPQAEHTPLPHSLENPSELPSVPMELNDAIQMALANGEIMRSLGGSVVAAAGGTASTYDPALIESGSGGVEAALSRFDAQVSSQLFWQKNNQPNNTTFLVFQPIASEQTLGNFNYALSKTTATGATWTARHSMIYNRNNSPARFFASDFTGFFEAQYRQPLMQGAGLDFNRIAGPGSPVGSYNGVLIARIRTDISLADFESSVINFVRDVETAYWDLYFAYHNLEAQVAGRNSSLLTWQRIKELQKVGARGGDAAAEAQARSQYYNFDVLVKDSLTGPTGLYTQEQRLRYLLGMQATDGSLIKPVTKPMEGEVIYDWHAALSDAMTKRVEIRRQKWTVKQRELELFAAKLNKRPTLDFVGQYRYRGLGDHLIGSRDPNNSFESVYQNIFEGDYQEWQAGFELGYPVGMRQAGAAIANARWNLAKSKAILCEQELRISHDLSNASRNVTRAHALMQANYNRQASDRDRVQALQARYESGLDNINFLLQAQQALAQSQTAYYRSLVDYQIALRDFHLQKGSLLNYNQVSLSEGGWPGAAYQDARERGRFFTPRNNPGAVDVPNPVSRGQFSPTDVGAGGGAPMITDHPHQEALESIQE